MTCVMILKLEINMELHENQIKNIIDKTLELEHKNSNIFEKFNSLEKLFNKYIHQNYSLIFQHMDNWEIIVGFLSYKNLKNKTINFHSLNSDRYLRAFSIFIISVSKIHEDQNSESIKGWLLERLFGLNSGISLSAFENELSAYIHFKRLGFNVELVDLNKGKNIKYDLEISKEGTNFSVECKEIQNFCGSPIYSEAAVEFINLLSGKEYNSSEENTNIVECNFDGILTKSKSSKIIDCQITPDELIRA